MPKLCMIPHSVSKNKNFLEKLAKTSSKSKRLFLLKNASDEELSILTEIIYNILHHNFNLHKTRKRTLTPHAEALRKISRVKSSKGARVAFNQFGGSIPFSSILIPVLLEAASQLIK